MKTVPLIEVLVRRDAMTTLPAHVSPHELPILQAVHGEDNVYPSEKEVGSAELDPATEVERLVGKYGEGPVAEAYGANFKGAINKALSSIEATGKAKKAPVPA